MFAAENVQTMVTVLQQVIVNIQWNAIYGMDSHSSISKYDADEGKNVAFTESKIC